MRKTILAALVASFFVIALTTLLVTRKSAPVQEKVQQIPVVTKPADVQVRTLDQNSFDLSKTEVTEEDLAVEANSVDEILDAAVSADHHGEGEGEGEGEGHGHGEGEGEGEGEDSDSDYDSDDHDDDDHKEHHCGHQNANGADCRAKGRKNGWCKHSNPHHTISPPCTQDDDDHRRVARDELDVQVHLTKRMRDVSVEWANEMEDVMKFNNEFSRSDAENLASVVQDDSVLGRRMDDSLLNMDASKEVEDDVSQFTYILNQFNQATLRIELNEFSRRNLKYDLVSKTNFASSKVADVLEQFDDATETPAVEHGHSGKFTRDDDDYRPLCAAPNARAANCATRGNKNGWNDRRGYKRVSAHRQRAMSSLLNQAQIVQWFSEDTKLRGYVLPLAEAVEYNQNLLDDKMTVREDFVPILLPTAASPDLERKVDILIDLFNLYNTEIELSLLQISE